MDEKDSGYSSDVLKYAIFHMGGVPIRDSLIKDLNYQTAHSIKRAQTPWGDCWGGLGMLNWMHYPYECFSWGI